MGLFGKNKKDASDDKPKQSAQVVQTGSVSSNPFYTFSNYTPMNVDNRIYAQLREGVPIIDSAINKIVRLMGGFRFETDNESLSNAMNEFFACVNVGGNQHGIQSFVDSYVEQLLTYGTAVGEIIADENCFYALYNGELDVLDVKRKDNGIDLEFFNTSSGMAQPIRHPNNILFSVLNPQPGKILGTSLLRGLPFVSDILLKIYSTIGSNWERVGNLRYAVTYKPQGDGTDAAFAKERANQMASAWKDAMSSKDSVKDFVAVGDVKVSVIGADNQILDSEIPVRQMLEQIIAKTGLMPYMFGLSCSTTEKMSRQQADILTTELAAYRRIITPILKKIGMAYLTVNGIANDVEIVWDRITLQDETEHAQARYYNAMADNLIKEADDGSVSNPKMQDR